jgi:hypothetical protein
MEQGMCLVSPYILQGALWDYGSRGILWSVWNNQRCDAESFDADSQFSCDGETSIYSSRWYSKWEGKFTVKLHVIYSHHNTVNLLIYGDTIDSDTALWNMCVCLYSRPCHFTILEQCCTTKTYFWRHTFHELCCGGVYVLDETASQQELLTRICCFTTENLHCTKSGKFLWLKLYSQIYS